MGFTVQTTYWGMYHTVKRENFWGFHIFIIALISTNINKKI